MRMCKRGRHVTVPALTSWRHRRFNRHPQRMCMACLWVPCPHASSIEHCYIFPFLAVLKLVYLRMLVQHVVFFLALFVLLALIPFLPVFPYFFLIGTTSFFSSVFLLSPYYTQNIKFNRYAHLDYIQYIGTLLNLRCLFLVA